MNLLIKSQFPISSNSLQANKLGNDKQSSAAHGAAAGAGTVSIPEISAWLDGRSIPLSDDVKNAIANILSSITMEQT